MKFRLVEKIDNIEDAVNSTTEEEKTEFVKQSKIEIDSTVVDN